MPYYSLMLDANKCENQYGKSEINIYGDQEMINVSHRDHFAENENQLTSHREKLEQMKQRNKLNDPHLHIKSTKDLQISGKKKSK